MATIKIQQSHPDFSPPTFGLIDFGQAAAGLYSDGYKMIAFEPGKILQAQELNEVQFRMNVHQTLTMRMLSEWTNFICMNGSESSTGPGWDGATPISPNKVQQTGDSLYLANNTWYLCKTNSNGLFFWVYFAFTGTNAQLEIQNAQVGDYVGFTLSTTANGEYTGELVDCNNTGAYGNFPLTINNSSVCGSSRYYLRITNVTTSTTPISNDFVGIAQRTAEGFYFLNNIKV